MRDCGWGGLVQARIRGGGFGERLGLKSTFDIRVAVNRWTQADIKLPILGETVVSVSGSARHVAVIKHESESRRLAPAQRN